MPDGQAIRGHDRGRAAGDDHAIAAGQVGPHLDIDESGVEQQRLHLTPLVRADLEYERAARSEPRASARDDQPQRVETVGTRVERGRRLPGLHDRLDVVGVGGDIGRVRDDHVRRHVERKCVEPGTGGDPDDARRPPESGEIRARQIERRLARVREPDRGSLGGEFIGDRQPDGAGPGAEIDDRAGRAVPAGDLDRHPGDHFGFRSRDQRPRIDRQVDAPEAPVTQHVLHRLARAVAGEHRFEVGHHPLGRLVPEQRDELGGIDRGGLLAQPPGVCRIADRVGGLSQHLSPGDDRVVDHRAGRSQTAITVESQWNHGEPSASSLARSSAARASTTIWRSPASTSVRRYTVNPMR